MTDQMRAEFEVWAEDHGHRLDRDHANGGYYKDGDTDLAWCAWKDSRAALVVELPVPIEPECPEDAFDDSWMDGYNGKLRMREACKRAIDAAGIKVKP